MSTMQEIPILSQDIILLVPKLQNQDWLISTHSSKTPFRISESMGRLLIWISEGCIASTFPFSKEKDIDENSIKKAIKLLQINNLVTVPSSRETALPTPKYHLTICHSLEERMKLEDNNLPTSHIIFNSLFDIQWHIFNNSKNFKWLKYITTPVLIRVATASFLFFGIIGLLALAFKWDLFFESMSTPISGIDFFWLFLSIFLIISLHELCHGGLLTYYGGKIKSMGVMLLYLSPAFFCDITNGWYLPRKSQRVLIALAGVLSTFGITGVLALSFALWGNSSNLWLGVCTIYLYVGVILNLIPFVRFDGYIALMTALDEPYLREHTMREWKILTFQILSGQWKRTPIKSIIRAIYGIFCSLTPLIFLLIPFFSQIAPTTWFSWAISVIVSLFVWSALVLLIRGIYLISIAPSKKFINVNKRIGIFLFCLLALSPFLFIPMSTANSGFFIVNENSVEINLPSKTSTSEISLYSVGTLAKRYLDSINFTQSNSSYIYNKNVDSDKLNIIIPKNRINFYLPSEGLVESPSNSVPLYASLSSVLSFHIHNFINLLHQKGGEP